MPRGGDYRPGLSSRSGCSLQLRQTGYAVQPRGLPVRARLRVLLPLVTMLVAWWVQSTSSFTTEQASAGRTAYEQNCATCHGANLRQLPDALLVGREFAAKWGSRSTNELVAQMRSTMPPGNAGGLPEETYLAIAAYVLQANGGGADGQALTARTATRISDAMAGVVRRRQPSAHRLVRTGVTVAGTVPGFVPVTDAILRKPNAADWLMIRRDYSATSYSPLTQITAANASTAGARLDVADARGWHQSTGAAGLQRHDVSGQHRRHRPGAERTDRTADLGTRRRRRGRAARARALRQPVDLSQRGGVGPQPAGRVSRRARRTDRGDRLEGADARRLCEQQRPDHRQRPHRAGHGHLPDLRREEVLHQRLRPGNRSSSAGASARSRGKASRAARRGARCRISIVPAGRPGLRGATTPS